jgi:hypothetical protein
MVSRPLARQVPTILRAACLAALVPGAPGAPVNRIPDDQPALRRVFPPGADELVAPGTEKFVLFSRESIGSPEDWDFLACAWEFIPSRPEAGVVKRVEFARSSWSATLAVDAAMGIEGPARNLVLHQVDDSRRPLRRNLHHIDFRTWEVRSLGEAPFVSVEGGNAERLLVSCEDGYRTFRVATWSLDEEASFRWIDSDRESGCWLVDRRADRGTETWSFRPDEFAFVRELPPLPAAARELWGIASAARADGGAWAMVTVGRPRREPAPAAEPVPAGIPATPANPAVHFRPGVVPGTVWFGEAGMAGWKSWPVEFLATPGSGIPWTSGTVALWFEGEELVVQTTTDPAGNARTVHQWNVTGDGEIRRSLAESLRRQEWKAPEIPAEFQGWFQPGERYSGDPGALAAAFLRFKGLAQGLPGYADRNVGVSADRRRFLWKSSHSRAGLPPPEVLLHLDLEKGTVVEVPCPPELVHDNALGIAWVRCGTPQEPLE